MTGKHEQAVTVTSQTWWGAVADRLVRQFAQTAGPILVLLATQGLADEPKVVVFSLVSALLLTLGKAVLQTITASAVTANSPYWVRLADRVGPAFAGVIVAAWPASLESVGSIAWADTITAAGAASVLAALQFYISPAVALPTTQDETPVVEEEITEEEV